MMRLRRPSIEALLTFAFIVIGLLWGGFLGDQHMAGLDSALGRLEYLTLDWRFLLAGSRPAPRGVVIAAVDDDTLGEAGGYPLPRDVLARIVRELAAHGPQVIAIDMLFVDLGKPDSDALLADALRASPAVIAAAGLFDKGRASSNGRPDLMNADGVPAPSDVLWPITAVRSAARTGLVNVSTDETGVPRFVPMIFRAGDTIAPSFVLAAASAALNAEPIFANDTLKLAGRAVRMDSGYHLPIRYYGPRGAVRQFSAAQVLRGNLDPEDVRGQVVVLGMTATGLSDTFAIPFDRIVPGVEIVATAISNLLAGDGLIRNHLTREIDAATAIVLPCLLVLLLAIRRTAIGFCVALSVVALWTAAVYAAFTAGYWLDLAIPLAAAAPVTLTYGVARVVRDRAAARRLTGEKQTLAKFISPLLVEQILANPQFLEKPVGQDVPVVFVDLSGFTGVAEALGPQWTRDLLADFQARLERDVVAHGGFVVDFMGDGAMIILGLPAARPDDGSRALRMMVEIRKSITAWLGTLPPVAKSPLSVRLGGHFGPVTLSRLGAPQHQHVTATGDTVNAASRLLEIAKQQNASAIVTEDLWNAASAPVRDEIAAGLPRDADIRGRAQALRIRVLN
jgi:adenylate cyclase